MACTKTTLAELKSRVEALKGRSMPSADEQASLIQASRIGKNLDCYLETYTGLLTSIETQVSAPKPCNSGKTFGRGSGPGVVSAITQPSTSPAPVLAAATQSQSSILLTWDDPSNAETGFELQRSLDQTTWATIATRDPDEVSYLSEGLDPATTYYFRVRTIFVGGSFSAWSNIASDMTGAPEVPEAPSNLVITGRDRSFLSLGWQNNSGAESHQDVQQSLDGVTWDPPVSLKSVGTDIEATSVFGLTQDTLYYFRVRSCNAVGCSGYSNVASAYTRMSPISTLVAAATSTASIEVTWTDSLAAAGRNYDIDRATAPFGPWASVVSGVSVFTATDAGLDPSTTYYYRVRATSVASGQVSDYLGVSAATDAEPEEAPTNLTVTTLSASSLQVDWVDAASSETAYSVERSLDGATGWTVVSTEASNATSYVDTGLADETQYYYRVRALGEVASAYSNIDSAFTDALPLVTPTGLVATPTSSSQIDLTWNDNSDAEDDYEVERSLDGETGWTTIASLPPNSEAYTDTGLDAETTYYYRVIAVCAELEEWVSISSGEPFTDLTTGQTFGFKV